MNNRDFEGEVPGCAGVARAPAVAARFPGRPVNGVTPALGCTCESWPRPTVGISSLARLSGFWPRPLRASRGLFSKHARPADGVLSRQIRPRGQVLQEFSQNGGPFLGIYPAREVSLVAIELEIGGVDDCRCSPFPRAGAD